MSSNSSSSGRKLFGAPRLLQDWDEQVEEGAAQYWELFLDLLLVAAASSVADEFRGHLTGSGFWEFAVLSLIMINGWMLYTHHVTTRFEDSSLAHSVVLFVYLVGFGLCIVNASYENVGTFAAGAILQRGSILVMLATVAHSIPRARYFCGILATVTVLAMLGLAMALVWAGDQRVSVFGLWLAATIEGLIELIIINCLEGRRLIPVNIEQSKERLGALELIMLGETVLSVTITYRELKEEDIVEDAHQSDYYWVLGLSFLLIFMFTLLYFHMQPSPREHAFRRSRLIGCMLMVAHKVLALALLCMGVSVKLVVRAVVLKEEMTPFGSRLMGWSVGAALAILFAMRYLHYGGKSAIYFGNKVLRYSEHVQLGRIARLWWWTVGCVWLLPFLGVLTGLTTRDPLISTALHSGLLFLLCVVESSYSHMIEDALPEPTPGDSEERQSLTATSTSQTTSYQDTRTN